MQRPPAPKPNTQRQGQQHDPSGAPIQIAQPQAWALSQDLERRLKAELKRRSFWDLEVRRIRHGLQKAYENVMFSNFEFSQANEVEQALWKSTFYKPIEEFRTRMRTAGQAVQEAQKSGAGGEDGGSDIGKQQQKLTAAYLKFLDEAVVFYKRLVWKLQWVYGEAGAAVQIDATVQNEIRQAVPRAEESRDCRSAVHRCLIYLGDLCRYQSQVMAGARIEWNRAVSFYQLAATVLPNSGNPFNQMAVMAYYSNQELRAVYYYFRSLGVSVPFVTARDNLLLLFERNRSRYSQLPRPGAPGVAPGSNLEAVFVRLHGMLFDRINLDQFKSVADAAYMHLDALLGDESSRENLQRHPCHDHLLLHLTVLSAFSIHNTTTTAAAASGGATSGGGGPSPGAGHVQGGAISTPVPPRKPVQGLAIIALLRLATALCHSATTARPTQAGYTALMVGVHIIAMWLQSNPALAALGACSSASSPPSSGGSGGGGEDRGLAQRPHLLASLPDGLMEEEVLRRIEFWRAALRLIHSLLQEAGRRKIQVCSEDKFLPAQLGEDAELSGFLPLQQALAGFPTWCKSAPDEASMRLQRTIHAFKRLAEALPLPPAVGSGGHALSQNGAAPLGGSKARGRMAASALTAALAAARSTTPASEASLLELEYATGDVRQAVLSAFSPRLAVGHGPRGGAGHGRESSNGQHGSEQQSEPLPPSGHPQEVGQMAQQPAVLATAAVPPSSMPATSVGGPGTRAPVSVGGLPPTASTWGSGIGTSVYLGGPPPAGVTGTPLVSAGGVPPAAALAAAGDVTVTAPAAAAAAEEEEEEEVIVFQPRKQSKSTNAVHEARTMSYRSTYSGDGGGGSHSMATSASNSSLPTTGGGNHPMGGVGGTAPNQPGAPHGTAHAMPVASATPSYNSDPMSTGQANLASAGEQLGGPGQQAGGLAPVAPLASTGPAPPSNQGQATSADLSPSGMDLDPPHDVTNIRQQQTPDSKHPIPHHASSQNPPSSLAPALAAPRPTSLPAPSQLLAGTPLTASLLPQVPLPPTSLPDQASPHSTPLPDTATHTSSDTPAEAPTAMDIDSTSATLATHHLPPASSAYPAATHHLPPASSAYPLPPTSSAYPHCPPPPQPTTLLSKQQRRQLISQLAISKADVYGLEPIPTHLAPPPPPHTLTCTEEGLGPHHTHHAPASLPFAGPSSFTMPHTVRTQAPHQAPPVVTAGPYTLPESLTSPVAQKLRASLANEACQPGPIPTYAPLEVGTPWDKAIHEDRRSRAPFPLQPTASAMLDDTVISMVNNVLSGSPDGGGVSSEGDIGQRGRGSSGGADKAPPPGGEGRGGDLYWHGGGLSGGLDKAPPPGGLEGVIGGPATGGWNSWGSGHANPESVTAGGSGGGSGHPAWNHTPVGGMGGFVDASAAAAQIPLVAAKQLLPGSLPRAQMLPAPVASHLFEQLLSPHPLTPAQRHLEPPPYQLAPPQYQLAPMQHQLVHPQAGEARSSMFDAAPFAFTAPTSVATSNPQTPPFSNHSLSTANHAGMSDGGGFAHTPDMVGFVGGGSSGAGGVGTGGGYSFLDHLVAQHQQGALDRGL